MCVLNQRTYISSHPRRHFVIYLISVSFYITNNNVYVSLYYPDNSGRPKSGSHFSSHLNLDVARGFTPKDTTYRSGYKQTKKTVSNFTGENSLSEVATSILKSLKPILWTTEYSGVGELNLSTKSFCEEALTARTDEKCAFEFWDQMWLQTCGLRYPQDHHNKTHGVQIGGWVQQNRRHCRVPEDSKDLGQHC